MEIERAKDTNVQCKHVKLAIRITHSLSDHSNRSMPSDRNQDYITPAFGVTCKAAIFQHSSNDMLNKQSKSTNHSLLAWPSELVGPLA